MAPYPKKPGLGPPPTETNLTVISTPAPAPTNQDPRSFSNISTELVTFRVGPDEKKFQIHRGKLMFHSAWFVDFLPPEQPETPPPTADLSLPTKKRKRGGKSKFQREEKACQGVIVIREVEEAVFKTFMDWVYNERSLADRTSGIWVQGLVDHAHIVYLYVFATRYEVPVLRDSIIRIWFQDLRNPVGRLPEYTVVTYAFERLEHDSPLCRLLVNAYVRYFDRRVDEGDRVEAYCREALPSSFLIAVMLKMGDTVQKMRNGELDCGWELSLDEYLEKDDIREGVDDESCALSDPASLPKHAEKETIKQTKDEVLQKV